MVNSCYPHTFSKKFPVFWRINQPSASWSSNPNLTLMMKANYGNYLPTDTASCPRRLESSTTPLWESQISHLALTFQKWNSSWVTVSAEPALTFTCKTSLTEVYLSFIHSIGTCRMWRFLAVLKSFFHSSPMYFTLSPFSTIYSSILSHLILPSISWYNPQSCCSQIHI